MVPLKDPLIPSRQTPGRAPAAIGAGCAGDATRARHVALVAAVAGVAARADVVGVVARAGAAG